MYIYDKDDVLFGCIKRDVTRPRYVLTSRRGGVQLLFEGDFVHKMSVSSDSGEKQSCSEASRLQPDSSRCYYQVCIVAGADVGLMVSGFISIDAMEAR